MGEAPLCSRGTACALSHLTAVVPVACRETALLTRFEKEKAASEAGKADLTHLNFTLPTSHHGKCLEQLMSGEMTRALPPSGRGGGGSFCGLRTPLR